MCGWKRHLERDGVVPNFPSLVKSALTLGCLASLDGVL
jgi:hypothetical protein